MTRSRVSAATKSRDQSTLLRMHIGTLIPTRRADLRQDVEEHADRHEDERQDEDRGGPNLQTGRIVRVELQQGRVPATPTLSGDLAITAARGRALRKSRRRGSGRHCSKIRVHALAA